MVLLWSSVRISQLLPRSISLNKFLSAGKCWHCYCENQWNYAWLQVLLCNTKISDSPTFISWCSTSWWADEEEFGTVLSANTLATLEKGRLWNPVQEGKKLQKSWWVSGLQKLLLFLLLFWSPVLWFWKFWAVKCRERLVVVETNRKIFTYRYMLEFVLGRIVTHSFFLCI